MRKKPKDSYKRIRYARMVLVSFKAAPLSTLSAPIFTVPIHEGISSSGATMPRQREGMFF